MAVRRNPLSKTAMQCEIEETVKSWLNHAYEAYKPEKVGDSIERRQINKTH